MAQLVDRIDPRGQITGGELADEGHRQAHQPIPHRCLQAQIGHTLESQHHQVLKKLGGDRANHQQQHHQQTLQQQLLIALGQNPAHQQVGEHWDRQVEQHHHSRGDHQGEQGPRFSSEGEPQQAQGARHRRRQRQINLVGILIEGQIRRRRPRLQTPRAVAPVAPTPPVQSQWLLVFCLEHNQQGKLLARRVAGCADAAVVDVVVVKQLDDRAPGQRLEA